MLWKVRNLLSKVLPSFLLSSTAFFIFRKKKTRLHFTTVSLLSNPLPQCSTLLRSPTHDFRQMHTQVAIPVGQERSSNASRTSSTSSRITEEEGAESSHLLRHESQGLPRPNFLIIWSSITLDWAKGDWIAGG